MLDNKLDDMHSLYSFFRDLINSLRSESQEKNPFDDMFGGELREVLTCLKCKTMSTTFTPFVDITLDIMESQTIDEALSNYFKQKDVGKPGDESTYYKCRQCKVKVPAKCQSSIEKAPMVLCLTLKRFDFIGANAVFKIDKLIKLSRDLNLRPYLSKSGTLVKYSIRSAIKHIGLSPHSGHYTAVGEVNKDSFYEFNDQNIPKPINIPAVLNAQNTYVVFYELAPSSWSELFQSSKGLCF